LNPEPARRFVARLRGRSCLHKNIKRHVLNLYALAGKTAASPWSHSSLSSPCLVIAPKPPRPPLLLYPSFLTAPMLWPPLVISRNYPFACFSEMLETPFRPLEKIASCCAKAGLGALCLVLLILPCFLSRARPPLGPQISVEKFIYNNRVNVIC